MKIDCRYQRESLLYLKVVRQEARLHQALQRLHLYLQVSAATCQAVRPSLMGIIDKVILLDIGECDTEAILDLYALCNLAPVSSGARMRASSTIEGTIPG